MPLLIHLPEGPTGRNSEIVQPQDIAATILGLAACSLPETWVGRDLLSPEMSLARPIALTGPAVGAWRADLNVPLFSLFDPEWYLNVFANPEACRLFRYGSVEDVAGDYPDVVSRLRDAGLAEAERRGTDTRLIAWLRSGGEGNVPGGGHTVAWPCELALLLAGGLSRVGLALRSSRVPGEPF